MTDTSPDLLEALRSGAVLARVKPLEWEHSDGNLPGQEVWSSGDPWMFWIVTNKPGEFIWCESLGFADMVPASPVRGSFAALDEAKAAAQADYSARILSALSPDPDLVALIEGLRKERDAESRNAGRYADEALALRGDIAAADALRIMWHDRALAAEAERDALRERAERAFVAGLEAAAQYLEACNDYGDRLKATEIRALTQDQPNDGE